MGLYSKYLLPKIIDFACSQKPAMKQREKVVPLAHGEVLEIGIGSGLNLPYYQADKVKQVTGIDPSREMWNQSHQNTPNTGLPVSFIQSSAENLPLDSKAFDSVVVTYTLCTIPELAPAFDEIRRVLKPKGKLIFCEHGKAPDPSVARWQNQLNPIWKKFGGGCNLNRDIPNLMKVHGFKIERLDTMYIPGWKPASFNFWGTASVS